MVITGNNRSLCTDLAAANCYKLDHLKQPEIWKLVEDAKVYYVGGYHLTVCVPAILALAEEAAAKNKVRSRRISHPKAATDRDRSSPSPSPPPSFPNSSRSSSTARRRTGTT